MTVWNFYFQIFEKAVGKEETILFLTHLLRYIKTPLLVVWDRLPAHRSRLVGQFLDSLDGRIAIEYLPPYAPELNPVEYLWGHWKHHTLPNVCPKDLWQLSEGARRTLRRLRRRPRLITAFWKQSSLRSTELYYANLSKSDPPKSSSGLSNPIFAMKPCNVIGQPV
jgi:transposase